jgi:hypothetical protein
MPSPGPESIKHVATLHIWGGKLKTLGAQNRIQYPFIRLVCTRIERVSVAAVSVLVWISHQH